MENNNVQFSKWTRAPAGRFPVLTHWPRIAILIFSMVAGGAVTAGQRAPAEASCLSDRELEIAVDNLVASLDDDRRQSQLLSAEISRGVTMTVEEARQKLAEAKVRRSNVEATIAEQRALVKISCAYIELSAKIKRLKEMLEEESRERQ